MERERNDPERNTEPNAPEIVDLEQTGTEVNPDTLETYAQVDAPEIEPDFTDSRMDTSSIDVTEVSEEVYFPPTDSPVAQGHANSREVMDGGFEPTSMSTIHVDASASGRGPGDEALADAIRTELRQDAATQGLQVEVLVENGIACLRGRVADLDDVENAEEVAGRIPGVREVIEELEMEG